MPIMLVFGKVLWMDNQTNGRTLVSLALELLCDMCFLIIDGLVKKIKIIIVEENFRISILLDVRNSCFSGTLDLELLT